MSNHRVLGGSVLLFGLCAIFAGGFVNRAAAQDVLFDPSQTWFGEPLESESFFSGAANLFEIDDEFEVWLSTDGVASPADEARHAAEEGNAGTDETGPEVEGGGTGETAPGTDGEAESDGERKHVPTYAMPAIVIEGEPLPELRENERIGAYKQPRWSAHRRFPSTRIYVRPEGEFDIEFWTRVKAPRDGRTSLINQLELEFGLPARFQLDVYFIWERKGHDGVTSSSISVELRWALADWGVIPTNPTLYFEWKFISGGPDVMELKLLLGDSISERVHWGINFVWEQQVDDERETVLEITGGISYTIIDGVLSIGIETKSEIANTQGNRDIWEENLRVGPSLQWSPIPAMHILIAPLFGITKRSKLVDMFVVVGWEF